MALTDAHERRQLARDLVEQAFTLLRQARKRSARGRDAWHKEREARVEAGKLFADARRLERQAAEDVLRTTRVLCGTLTGLAEHVLPAGDEPDFDVLVVDEASQALTPALLLGVLRARRETWQLEYYRSKRAVAGPGGDRECQEDHIAPVGHTRLKGRPWRTWESRPAESVFSPEV